MGMITPLKFLGNQTSKIYSAFYSPNQQHKYISKLPIMYLRMRIKAQRKLLCKVSRNEKVFSTLWQKYICLLDKFNKHTISVCKFIQTELEEKPPKYKEKILTRKLKCIFRLIKGSEKERNSFYDKLIVS